MLADIKKNGAHMSAALSAWADAKNPTNQENEAIVKEWLAQTVAKDGNFIDAIVGSLDDAEFERAIFGIMMEGVSGCDYQIITGAADLSNVAYYTQVLDAIGIVGGVDITIPTSDSMTNKLFAISHAVMALHIDACKHNSNTQVISSILKPAVYFNDPVKYNATVRDCIVNLFKPDAVMDEKDTVFKDTGQVNKLLGAMARVKVVLTQRVPDIEEIIADIEQELSDADNETPKDEVTATSALLNEMRYALDYAIRLNTLVNRILVGMNKFCDRVKLGDY